MENEKRLKMEMLPSPDMTEELIFFPGEVPRYEMQNDFNVPTVMDFEQLELPEPDVDAMSVSDEGQAIDEHLAAAVVRQAVPWSDEESSTDILV